MRKIFLLLFLLAFLASNAQVERLLGEWVSVDEKTGEQKSVIKICAPDANHPYYYGVVSKILMRGAPADARCTECKGDDKDKPVVGLTVIRKMQSDGATLTGGTVLDPENGKIYYAKISLDGETLVLRGSLDSKGWLGRTQRWFRPSANK